MLARFALAVPPSSRVNPLPQGSNYPCGSGFTREEGGTGDTNYCPASLRISLPFLSSGMVEPGSRSIFTWPTWSPMVYLTL